MAENEEELKSLLMRVEEDSEKAGLKLNIQKLKITASSPITSRQTEEEKVETVKDFTFLGSKSLWMVTAATKLKTPDPWKAITNLDSVLKSRNITLPTKIRIIKAMVFSIVMYGCENWTIKAAEC